MQTNSNIVKQVNFVANIFRKLEIIANLSGKFTIIVNVRFTHFKQFKFLHFGPYAKLAKLNCPQNKLAYFRPGHPLNHVIQPTDLITEGNLLLKNKYLVITSHCDSQAAHPLLIKLK